MQSSHSFLIAVVVIVLGVVISGGHAATLSKRARQEVAGTPTVVTVASGSTPSVIDKNTPELVPAVIDPNPTTVAPPTTPTVSTTTVKPEDGDDDDSSEEEEEDADEEDQDQDDDADEEQEENDVEEGAPGAKQIYLPGYLTNHGELLVPIDAVQRGTGDRVHYEVIEDPTYPAYAQFANAENGEDVATPAVAVGGGNSAGGIGGGEAETVLDILQQPGSPQPQPSTVVAVSHESSEPSEEAEEQQQPGQEPIVPPQANIQEQQRHLWLGGSNPSDFGFHF